MKELIKNLEELNRKAEKGGGDARIEKQHSVGKLTARERIELLLEKGSFIELDKLVTHRCTDFGMEKQKFAGDGVVTGYGMIGKRLVYVFAQDFTVFGGALSETHAKKICKVMDMAMQMGAPIIGLNDSGGARIQEGVRSLAGYAEIFLRNSMASGVIPQVTAIFGMCGGGLAIVPGLADFTFMEEKDGKLFVNSPNALEGNEISRCNTASAAYQSKTAGLVDGIGTEAEILGQIRSLVCMIPANYEDDMSYEECTDDLNRVCADIANASEDTAIALAQIADNGVLVETKKDYAKEMVTGFIRLNGQTVGVVANRSKVYGADAETEAEFDAGLTVDGCAKAADFVNFCDAFSIPVLTLTNVAGFAATVESEKNMAKAVARLTYAFANATVPKVNVIVGKAFGSAYVAMNSKSVGADLVYAWPTAEIGMMDAKLAAQIMYPDADADTQSAKAAKYKELQSSPNAAAARGYVDAIIEPADTRKYVIGAFEMLFTKRENRPDKKHGTV